MTKHIRYNHSAKGRARNARYESSLKRRQQSTLEYWRKKVARA